MLGIWIGVKFEIHGNNLSLKGTVKPSDETYRRIFARINVIIHMIIVMYL
jgi:hypothetical protein